MKKELKESKNTNIQSTLDTLIGVHRMFKPVRPVGRLSQLNKYNQHRRRYYNPGSLEQVE